MWHMLYGHLGPSFAWWRQWHRGLRQRNWEPAVSTFNAATCGNLASSTFPSWKDSSFTCKSMWQFDTFFVIFLAHKWPILPFAYSPWILSSDKDSMWKWWRQRNPFTESVIQPHLALPSGSEHACHCPQCCLLPRAIWNIWNLYISGGIVRLKSPAYKSASISSSSTLSSEES